MILDSNVVIEFVDAEVGGPFLGRLAAITRGHDLFTNAVIFAEVASGFTAPEQVAGLFADLGLSLAQFAPAECFRAGKAFADYRRRGGRRDAILPDFLIGAQAAIRGWPLVTCDRKGFASYFPDLRIIDPMEPSP